MGIFGKREKHSKETYENAEREAEGAYKNARFIGSLEGRNYSETQKQAIYDDLWVAASEAKYKLDKLLKTGHKEAVKLNDTYDKLRTKAQESVLVLAEFEKEELGMHKEDRDNVGEEDGVDEKYKV